MADHETKGALGGRYWDDLRAPTVAINPPGADSDPGRDATTGWLMFDKDATELVYVTYQMPHGWIEGSEFRPHVHWHKTTSATGTVAWRLRYRYCNLGQAWSGWSDPITTTEAELGGSDTAEVSQLSSFGGITIPSGRISMNLLCEIARVGSADTYAADVALTDVDVHIQINQAGSVQLYTKYNTDVQVEKKTT